MATYVRIRVGPQVPIVRCGELRLAETTVQEGAVPQFAATVWLLGGAASFAVRGEPAIALRPGWAFHRHPGVVHRVRFEAGTTVLYLAVPAEALALLRTLGVHGLDEPVIAPGLHSDLVRRWRVLAGERSRARPGADAPLAAQLIELIVALHGRMASSADPRLDAALEQAESELAAVGAPRRRLTAIARTLGLSERTFRRAFTSRTGMAPEAFRIRCRILAAQELLRGAEPRIAAIAAVLGYRDQAAFARQFTRVVGSSPSSFRQGC